MNGVKSGIVHRPARGSGEADRAVATDGAEGVGEDRTAHQFQCGVDAVRHQLAHLVGDGAVVDEGMVDARGPQFPAREPYTVWNISGSAPTTSHGRPSRTG
jgi:hypothetical protein